MAAGAGLLILRPPDGAVLLLRRSGLVAKAGHWGVPGGAVEPWEDEGEAALREGREELGGLPRIRMARVEPHWQADGPFFAFATFGAELAEGRGWEPALNWENDG